MQPCARASVGWGVGGGGEQQNPYAKTMSRNELPSMIGKQGMAPFTPRLRLADDGRVTSYASSSHHQKCRTSAEPRPRPVDRHMAAPNTRGGRRTFTRSRSSPVQMEYCDADACLSLPHLRPTRQRAGARLQLGTGWRSLSLSLSPLGKSQYDHGFHLKIRK